MKVYLLIKDYGYDGIRIEAVYSNKQLVEQIAKDLNDKELADAKGNKDMTLFRFYCKEMEVKEKEDSN